MLASGEAAAYWGLSGLMIDRSLLQLEGLELGLTSRPFSEALGSGAVLQTHTGYFCTCPYLTHTKLDQARKELPGRTPTLLPALG